MTPRPPIAPQSADEAIRARIVTLPVETLPLTQCVGAVLRQPVFAERDQPPFDRATMDGFAVQSAALRQGINRFGIQATQAAGEPALVLAGPGQAIEIMTGASMPQGTDCVIPVEQVRVADGFAEILGPVAGEAYHFVHRRASDAGLGHRLLPAGSRLRAPEIAVAASAGLSHLQVTRQPEISVISTGNELVEPGGPIKDFQIRRSNIYAVSAALLRRGFLRVHDAHAADTEADLETTLARHLAGSDFLILSGGVSKGKFDLVPKVLRHLGIEEVFHQVTQRPGKPMWFGTGPRGQAVFGLPGNPVSTLVCLVRYVIPAMEVAMGLPRLPQRACLAAPVTWQPALTQFLPVAITMDESCRLWAEPKPTNTSGDFLALTASDGFVELPPGPIVVPRSHVAPLYRW